MDRPAADGDTQRACGWPDLDAAATALRTALGGCYDLHNANCGRRSDLCCWRCTEHAHPDHPVGVTCVLEAGVDRGVG